MIVTSEEALARHNRLLRANTLLRAKVWVEDWANNNDIFYIIVGMSGGVDSLVTASICVEALGPKRVIGIMMPQGTTKFSDDLELSKKQAEYLGINYHVVDITQSYTSSIESLRSVDSNIDNNQFVTSNLPARLRMMHLYAIANQYGRAGVANTCNAAENLVGYATKFGDAAGDFSILHGMTKSMVRELGLAMRLPEEWVNKTPIDGLQPLSDEERLGISYDTIDTILTFNPELNEMLAECQECSYSRKDFNKVKELYLKNAHKLLPMPCFK